MTRKSAERALKEQLACRAHYAGHAAELTPDSAFTSLVDVWLDDLDLEGRLAHSTRSLYERNMRTLVLPTFRHFTLREITVSKVDRFLKTKASKSYSMAKQARGRGPSASGCRLLAGSGSPARSAGGGCCRTLDVADDRPPSVGPVSKILAVEPVVPDRGEERFGHRVDALRVVNTRPEWCAPPVDEVEDLPDQVALEAPNNLLFGFSLYGAAGDIGARGLVESHPDDHGPVEGGVELPVSAAVEAVPAAGLA
jgi:hypothetical protein